MTKYAPANEHGEKPYYVDWYDWGKDRASVVFADTAATARYRAVGRSRPGMGVRSVRRATLEDLAVKDAAPFAALTPDDFSTTT